MRNARANVNFNATIAKEFWPSANFCSPETSSETMKLCTAAAAASRLSVISYVGRFARRFFFFENVPCALTQGIQCGI